MKINYPVVILLLLFASCSKDSDVASTTERKYISNTDMTMDYGNGDLTQITQFYYYDNLNRLTAKSRYSYDNNILVSKDSLVFTYMGDTYYPLRKDLYDLKSGNSDPYETTLIYYNADSTLCKDSVLQESLATYYTYPSKNTIKIVIHYGVEEYTATTTATVTGPYSFVAINGTVDGFGNFSQNYTVSPFIKNPFWFANTPIQLYVGLDEDDPDRTLARSGENAFLSIKTIFNGEAAFENYNYSGFEAGYPGRMTAQSDDGGKLTILFTYKK